MFPYDLVIYDLDGTLLDSAPDIATAVDRTLAQWDLPVAGETKVRQWIGDGSRKLMQRAFADAGHPQVPVAELYEAFLAHYGDCMRDDSHAYAGVPETLHALSERGVRQAVCTNKPDPFVASLIEFMGLDDYIAAWLGGDSLPERKPSALPLRHLAEKFDTPIERCLMVGDSGTDMAAARNAGMPLALVTYGYHRGVDLSAGKAVAVVDDLRELLTL
ncbi:phosphoglycolate phosphatase [Oleiagrimonas sp. C23AA]|uniref:phosphoglycolate phosphatase n=1 Tax=Oleiagrimonas sp. C23AA TaxID=2719047 RepID=UPI0014245742|nr:phosphoglycolate phosphatase [Oleiagrimonas sp. C23AA]NII09728.1 phosphoglycolate phosphatase [Oleiagrimonas sp. C23AA]